MINRYNDQTINYGQMNLIFNTRNLWRNLVIWSREYLISRFAGIGISEDIYKRLVKATEEFGNTLRVIFGDQVAEKYAGLLLEAVQLFRDLVEAEMAGDVNTINEIVKQLYQNGYERAEYLASINPFWDAAQWKELIDTFFSYSFDEINSFLINDPKNIDTFDRLLKHGDKMGDYFANGLFNYITYSFQK